MQREENIIYYRVFFSQPNTQMGTLVTQRSMTLYFYSQSESHSLKLASYLGVHYGAKRARVQHGTPHFHSTRIGWRRRFRTQFDSQEQYHAAAGGWPEARWAWTIVHLSPTFSKVIEYLAMSSFCRP